MWIHVLLPVATSSSGLHTALLASSFFFDPATTLKILLISPRCMSLLKCSLCSQHNSRPYPLPLLMPPTSCLQWHCLFTPVWTSPVTGTCAAVVWKTFSGSILRYLYTVLRPKLWSHTKTSAIWPFMFSFFTECSDNKQKCVYNWGRYQPDSSGE